MHEMALCESIVDIIREEARRQDFARVTAVRLEVGPFSSVAPEALRFCFDAASRGTPAEGSRVEIVRTEGRAVCPDCRRSVVIAERFAACPVCGGTRLDVTGGDELRIRDLEVE